MRWYGTTEDIHDRRLAQEGLAASIAMLRCLPPAFVGLVLAVAAFQHADALALQPAQDRHRGDAATLQALRARYVGCLCLNCLVALTRGPQADAFVEAVNHGGHHGVHRAALAYVTLNLVGSAVFLVALALLYGAVGTLNLADMAARVAGLGDSRPVLAAMGKTITHIGGPGGGQSTTASASTRAR